jgi:hypothetical protein
MHKLIPTSLFGLALLTTPAFANEHPTEYQCYQVSESKDFDRVPLEHVCTFQSETRNTDPLAFRIELVTAGPMNTRTVHAQLELKMRSRAPDPFKNENVFSTDPDVRTLFKQDLTVSFSGKRAFAAIEGGRMLSEDMGTLKIGQRKLYYRLAK